MRRGLAVAAAAAALIAVAGCGGSEDEDFIDDYNEATKPLQNLRSDLGGTRAGGRNATAQLTRLADQAKKVNADLADLDAPDDAKKDFADLRGALKRSEGDLRDVAKASQEDDITLLTTSTQALAKDARAIDKAESAVKQKVED